MINLMIIKYETLILVTMMGMAKFQKIQALKLRYRRVVNLGRPEFGLPKSPVCLTLALKHKLSTQ